MRSRLRIGTRLDALQHTPPAPPILNGIEREDGWGFSDTEFRVNARGVVEVTGDRYEGLSGHELPDLLPWFRDLTGIDFSATEPREHVFAPVESPRRVDCPELVTALREAIGEGHVSVDLRERLRRGHGHTQSEVYALRYGTVPRFPDVVVRPNGVEEVERVMAIATGAGACVVPYGGGTNVSLALRCHEGETRPIVSLDMRRMNRVRWIDPVNRLACIEAGATGREIQTVLARAGFTMGHEPDSFELSTLGGWIATHASGMKKNRYGNIEDLVVDVTAVTPSGRIERDTPAPRESIGLAPTRWLFGSEGTLAVVTSAVVRLFPLPDVQKYGSIVFRDFETALGFLYELRQRGVMPASVRLVDNTQFQLGMVLKPRRRGLDRVKARVERELVTGLLGFDRDRMVACTLVFEGTRREVASQEREVYELAQRMGGLRGGGENGRRGYQLTFGIAYIRDFIMRHHVLAESFETSVSWSQALPLIERVKARLVKECTERHLPGRPFVTARVTQTYDSGVCVYFYFAFGYRGVERPSEVYQEIEAAARAEILAAGGSLSHHHGVGQLRAEYLGQALSDGARSFRVGLKRAVDPAGVLGAPNQGFASS